MNIQKTGNKLSRNNRYIFFEIPMGNQAKSNLFPMGFQSKEIGMGLLWDWYGIG